MSRSHLALVSSLVDIHEDRGELFTPEALPGLEDELITPPGDPEDVKVRDFFGVLRFCAIESPLRCPRVS